MGGTMTIGPYRSKLGKARILEARDILGNDSIPGLAYPLTCRWPEGIPVQGIVVFCHGLGSGGRKYTGVSAYWAAHGYLVLHPTFPDAIDIVVAREPELGLNLDQDLSGWADLPEVRARMFEILHAPFSWIARLDIVKALMSALPQVLEATCGPLPDPVPCAIAGHSFGAYTAQLVAGAEIDLPERPAQRFADSRFAAAILLSAQGRDQQGLRDGSWNGMTGPFLNVTGTRDYGAKGGDWLWKCEPYDFAPAGDKYLAVLENGDHHLGGLGGRQTQVPAQIDAVEQVTLAFLDAYLRDCRTASDWLRSIADRIGDCPVLFKSK
ncbi:hypothetical protein HFC70_25835 [Agrobacterium sp. a22-2]|uniref:alpha/beta hydrolase family protein n=1 Tax=Agrobacterium sp. a22-2 TaxID=2283840 RepID=UPI001446FA0D|nr:hypothetical protein [Agrobacterium sp. a22-2]NKN39776.1 hypothetical protein [Agrobacterium sp. a22-2]